MTLLKDLNVVDVIGIDELNVDDVYDISNYESGCAEEEGNFFCDDVLVHNCIPDYIKRRDDPKQEWKNEDPRITAILGKTFNIICYQEQLLAMWVRLAGFTAPEAEAARKIIAKKWVDKLPQIEEKWKRGAIKTLSEEVVKAWWDKMVDFGRYAFNLSHAVAYSLITYHCLYLKSHYPAEWWAAVMTECHPDKLGGYMNAARIDNVKFGNININALSREFSVRDNRVIPGLNLIKGIGDKASDMLCSCPGPFLDIDQMVEKLGKNKTAFERLIKLGAFNDIHQNRHGLWKWYMYKYVGGTDIRREIIDKLNPPEDVERRKREQLERYQRLYPNKKIPKTVLNFKPKLVVPTRDDVIAVYDEFTPAQILKMEKDLLGFYWSNPLDLYEHENNNVEAAKNTGILECVVQKLDTKRSKNNNIFYILKVTDGVQTTDVVLWADTVGSHDKRMFEELAGLKIYVDYNQARNSFKIANGASVIALRLKGCHKHREELVVVDEEPLW